jgi:hypothetical protein
VKTLTKIGIVIVGVTVAGGVLLRRHHAISHAATARPSGRAVHIPSTSESLTLDGELTETSWHTAPVTRFLGGDGKDARPYSEVRFLWSRDGVLHVGLYASDKNIVSAGVEPDGPVWRGDSFHLVFAKNGVEHSFDIGPTAHGPVLTDGERKSGGAWTYGWQSGARVALDMDEGTVDRPAEADEEWVIELNVPLASIGLEPQAGQTIDFSARRCDLDARGGPPLESPCPAIELALTLDP